MYDLYFDTITYIPANGFIRLTFSNGFQSSPNPYCTSNVPVLGKENYKLIVENEDSDATIKISNIGAINAGTRVTFDCRLVSTSDSASSIRPHVRVRTFYSLGVDYSMLDDRSSIQLNRSISNNYITPV